MRIRLLLTKSLEENAAIYFEKAKKAKRKLEGALVSVKNTKKRLAEQEKKKPEAEAVSNILRKRKKEWFEKFRWFVSSDGFLVIGGRDATTNEIIIKKHTDKNDLVFHTDMAGSPFFVVKSDNRQIPDTTIREAADATATFSRAWKLGMASSDVFYVKPEQVTKQARAGEYLTKGSFMITGKTTYVKNRINFAIGIEEIEERANKLTRLISGPISAVSKHAVKYHIVEQGEEKPSAIAKKLRKILGYSDIDEIIRMLPAGLMRLAAKKM